MAKICYWQTLWPKLFYLIFLEPRESSYNFEQPAESNLCHLESQPDGE